MKEGTLAMYIHAADKIIALACRESHGPSTSDVNFHRSRALGNCRLGKTWIYAFIFRRREARVYRTASLNLVMYEFVEFKFPRVKVGF